MNLSTVYSKTGKGARALASKSLSSEQSKVLSQVNGKLNAGQVLEEVGKFSEAELEKILHSLEREEYIRAVSDDEDMGSASGFEVSSVIEVAEISAEEFMKIESEAHGIHTEDKIRQQQEAEARARAYEEEQRLLAQKAKEQEEAERQLLMVTDMLANSDLAEKIDIEKLAGNEQLSSVEARKVKEAAKAAAKEEHIAKRREEKRLAKEQAEAKAKVALEKERLEAEQREIEAAMARTRAEAEARGKRETEENARRESERKAREEEAARAKAERNAEEQARCEAEAKAKHEAEERARHEEKARLKREAEELARIEAERKAREEAEARARREAEERAGREEEARARKEAKRIAQEEAEARARLIAEEKARLAADKEARKEAEASAKAEAKRIARAEAEAQAMVKAEERARRRAERTPIDFSAWFDNVGTIAKGAVIGIGAILVVLLVVIHFINLTALTAPIERLASASIKEPVQIGAVNASLWPSPHLVLESVTIGKSADIKIAKVHLSPIISTVFEDIKQLDAIEFDTVSLDQSNVARPVEWLANGQTSGGVIFKRIAFKKVDLQIPDLKLNPFSGQVALAANKVEHVTLNDEARKLQVTITPQAAGYKVAIEAHDWQAPIGAPVLFDTLQAEGRADAHTLHMDNIEASLYGGTLKASLTADWSALWQANGDFQLEKVQLQEVGPVFSPVTQFKGHLNTRGRYNVSADSLARLLDLPQVNARFEVSTGYLGGIDLVRAMHAGTGQSIGGTTRFDKLSGLLSLNKGHFQYRHLALDAGQLKAYGEFDILADKSLLGKVHTQLNIKNRPMQAHYTLGGKVGSASLK